VCSVRLGSWVRFRQTLQTISKHFPADGMELENFLEQQYIASIKNESKIYTACGDGQIPFISALDIAAVAFRALTDAKPHNTDYRILGPELLTYDEVYHCFRQHRCADSLRADRRKTQQWSGTRHRARQTLRGTKGSKVPRLGYAEALRKIPCLP